MIDLNELLSGQHVIGISGHVNPDGDCIGSCLGLYLYLKQHCPDKEIHVYLQKIPAEFAFLEGADCLETVADPEKHHDVFFCLDCSDPDRLGEFAQAFQAAGRRACIDHHVITNVISEWELRDEKASSTCELVCRLLGTDQLSVSMAEALYAGIVTDTGVFRFSCTSPETMRTAAALMDKGIPASDIIEKVYYGRTYVQSQLLGRALLESIRVLDGKVVFSVMRAKDMRFYGAEKSDLTGIVSLLKEIDGVEVAIFLYQADSVSWKVSLRSSDLVDVAAISAYFGGGGHKKAAGCTMQGSSYDVVNNLTKLIEEQLLSSEEIMHD